MNIFSAPGALSIDRLQVLIQFRSITASKVYHSTPSITSFKSISEVAQSRPPSVFPNLLDYSLQVRTIMASKCITKLAQSRPPCVSPNSLDYGIQVHMILASKSISQLAQSWPRSVLLSSLDLHFQVHLELLSSTACSQSRYTVCRWVAI